MATTVNDEHARMMMMGILKDGFEKQIKDRLFLDIMENQVKIFRETIDPIIKEKVDQFSIDGVDNIRDAMSMRDEIKIYCKWMDDKS